MELKDNENKDMLKKFADIAKNYRIKIITATEPVPYNDNSLDSLSSSAIRNNALDNTIFLLTGKPVNTGVFDFRMIKGRKTSPLYEIVKTKNIEKLKEFLEELDKKELSNSSNELGNYYLTFYYNMVTIVKDKFTQAREIIEKSTTFKNCISGKSYFEFWEKVAFQADNCEILLEKVGMSNIFESTTLEKNISSYKPIETLNILLENKDFKEKMEKEFNLLHYICSPEDFNNARTDFFKIILEKLDLKDKKINFKEVAENFDMKKFSLSIQSNNCYFNNTLNIFIYHSNYVFNENDIKTHKIEEDNKILINKKILNNTLTDKLPPKEVIKKHKI